MNLLDNIVVGESLNRGGKEGLLRQMDELAASRWQPITDERQPYRFELMPQLRAELEIAGFVVVDTPVFKVGDVNFTVKCDRLSRVITATDIPQDICAANKSLTSDLIDFLRRRNRVYVHSVTVFRMAMLGYLPPTVYGHVRSASGLKPE